MGDLAKFRTCPSRPFSNVGIDYAGPISIKEEKHHNSRSIKCDILIFACMTINAVHIEVVSELSTSAFIVALHLFVSRRGIPTHIYSDYGAKFIGANALLWLPTIRSSRL